MLSTESQPLLLTLHRFIKPTGTVRTVSYPNAMGDNTRPYEVPRTDTVVSLPSWPFTSSNPPSIGDILRQSEQYAVRPIHQYTEPSLLQGKTAPHNGSTFNAREAVSLHSKLKLPQLLTVKHSDIAVTRGMDGYVDMGRVGLSLQQGKSRWHIDEETRPAPLSLSRTMLKLNVKSPQPLPTTDTGGKVSGGNDVRVSGGTGGTAHLQRKSRNAHSVKITSHTPQQASETLGRKVSGKVSSGYHRKVSGKASYGNCQKVPGQAKTEDRVAEDHQSYHREHEEEEEEGWAQLGLARSSTKTEHASAYKTSSTTKTDNTLTDSRNEDRANRFQQTRTQVESRVNHRSKSSTAAQVGGKYAVPVRPTIVGSVRRDGVVSCRLGSFPIRLPRYLTTVSASRGATSQVFITSDGCTFECKGKNHLLRDTSTRDFHTAHTYGYHKTGDFSNECNRTESLQDISTGENRRSRHDKNQTRSHSQKRNASNTLLRSSHRLNNLQKENTYRYRSGERVLPGKETEKTCGEEELGGSHCGHSLPTPNHRKYTIVIPSHTDLSCPHCTELMDSEDTDC